MNQQRAKIGREEFEKGNREMEEFMRSVRDKSHSSGGLTISSITTETRTTQFLHSTQNESFHHNASQFYKKPQNGQGPSNFSINSSDVFEAKHLVINHWMQSMKGSFQIQKYYAYF